MADHRDGAGLGRPPITILHARLHRAQGRVAQEAASARTAIALVRRRLRGLTIAAVGASAGSVLLFLALPHPVVAVLMALIQIGCGCCLVWCRRTETEIQAIEDEIRLLETPR